MKYFYSTTSLLYAILLMALAPMVSFAQPCGIESKIKINCGTATCGYFADTSGFQPGWIGYKYVWVINDQLPIIQYSAPVIMYDQLGAGFNRLRLTVYGTNTVTGDSCIVEHENIFQATGDAVFPEFDVTVNGNTVTLNGTYKGGPNFGSPNNVYYDFGDGNISTSNSMFETYTYANSGQKWVNIYVQMYNSSTGGTANGQFGKLVNVGAPGNLEFSSIQNQTICDSISLLAISSPPFTTGSINLNFNNPTPGPVNGSYTLIDLIDVPGHDFIGVEGGAAGLLPDHNFHLVKKDDCTIYPDTISGYVFNDLNYNGILEPGENGMPGVIIYIQTPYCNSTTFSTVQAGYSTTTDANGSYELLVPHAEVQVSMSTPYGYTLTYPATYNFNVNYNTGSMHSGHNFGISALSVHLHGRTYLDDNNDSLFTSSDRGLPGVMLTAYNTITGLTYHTYSGTNGNYNFDLPPGNFIIRPVNTPLDSATFTPDSIIVNGGTGGSYYNKNFGYRSPVPTDFNLMLSSTSEARPGFDYTISSRIYNSGYQKGVGVLVCTYDPILTPLSVNPANGVVDNIAHTITWTTDSIGPGFAIHYSANFNIPSATPLGTVLTITSTITALPGTTENDLTDNSSTRNQTVVGSFDPNDKTVTPAGIGATGDVLHNTELNYLIRFQNTGTASAINVFVADTIDGDLDLNTLVIHRASHNYDLVINENVLTWRFFNINLPDSNTNEPGSHGFIEYSVSPKDGLSDGTPIENTAYIYFDFNAPVVTNTTLNTMQSSLTAVEEINTHQQLLVYPNPGSDKIILLPRGKVSGQISINLYDLTGKNIRSLYNGTYSSTPAIEADVRGLSSGVYIIEMQHDGGVEKTKWVKQ